MCRRAIVLAPVLLLAGCLAPDGGSTRPAQTPATTIDPPAAAFVGHVIEVNPRTATAVVDISPFAQLPSFMDGQIMLSRREDLRVTAQMRATGLQRGRTLGAIVLAGRPQTGDEVVIQPTPAAAPAPAR